jgi:membrane fusion protein, hemolysin D
LPPGRAERESPPSRVAVGLSVAMVLVALSGLVWSYVGFLDVVAVARGRVVPRDRLQLVQAVDPGVVSRIRVREGDTVRAGQLLLDVDSTVTDAEEIRLSKELREARLQAARLHALLSDPSQLERLLVDDPRGVALQARLLEDQRAEHQRRLEAAAFAVRQRRAAIAVTHANLERLEVIVGIQTQRADAFRSLLDRQFIATLQFLEVEERRVEKTQELAMERRRLEQEDAALAEAEAHYDVVEAGFRSARLAELLEWEARAASLEQEVVKASRRRSVQQITAPADGIVQQLSIKTAGAVVGAGEQVLAIVPTSGGVEVEVSIENKDVGFVRMGQPAEIKIDTFPFTRYGTVPGTVLAVSPDAAIREGVGLVYSARIQLIRDTLDVDGQAMPISAGMAVAAEIHLGRRRVMEFFLSPLLKRSWEALRER